MESKPDALHLNTSTLVVPTPTVVANTAQAPEIREDRLDTTVIPEALDVELGQETLTVSSPSAQETGVDVVSSSKNALTAVEVETEVESEAHGTDADTTTNDLAAKIIPEIEQPVMPTTDVFIFYSCENALANLFYLERATLPDM